MYEKFGSKELSIKSAKEFLYEWRILKIIRPIIIKELEILGLTQKINKKTIKLNEPLFGDELISDSYINIGIC